MTAGLLVLGVLFSLACFFCGMWVAQEDWRAEVELRLQAEQEDFERRLECPL